MASARPPLSSPLGPTAKKVGRSFPAGPRSPSALWQEAARAAQRRPFNATEPPHPCRPLPRKPARSAAGKPPLPRGCQPSPLHRLRRPAKWGRYLRAEGRDRAALGTPFLRAQRGGGAVSAGADPPGRRSERRERGFSSPGLLGSLILRPAPPPRLIKGGSFGSISACDWLGPPARPASLPSAP